MSEADETVWKVLLSTAAKVPDHQNVIAEQLEKLNDDFDEGLDIKEFTINFRKYKGSLRRFGVSAEEFLHILRERQDDLENIPSAIPVKEESKKEDCDKD